MPSSQEHFDVVEQLHLGVAEAGKSVSEVASSIDEGRVQVHVLLVIASLTLSEYSPLIARTTPSAPLVQ